MSKKIAVVLPEIQPMKIQTYYDRYHKDKGIDFDINESLTDQDFKMMTDVNYLLEHMAGHSRTPIYGIQEKSTFEDWSNEMALLKRRFLNLTLEEQARFGNAQNFLKWCADPNNYVDRLPSVIEGRITKEQLELKKKLKDEQNELLAKSLAKAIRE